MMRQNIVTLQNDRIEVAVDLEAGTIVHLGGCFRKLLGNSNDTGHANTVAHKRFDTWSNIFEKHPMGWHIDTGIPTEDPTFAIKELQTSDTQLHAVLTCPQYQITWNLHLDDWKLRVETELEAATQQPVSLLGLSLQTSHHLLVGMFNRGTIQQANAGDHYFSSTDQLHGFYTISGAGGALAVNNVCARGHVGGIGRGEVALGAVGRGRGGRGAVPEEIILHRSYEGVGLIIPAVGGLQNHDVWTDPNWRAQTQVNPGDHYTISFDLYANDADFPTWEMDNKQFPNPTDCQTHFTALYASSVAALGGYQVKGSTYPTIAAPTRTYWTLHTFFDPDAWATVWTLSASGNTYLQNEARRILDRSGTFITENGQLPHHFDVEKPIYVAISNAPQSGPNLFWIMAALDYVALSGDANWLLKNWEKLQAALHWVTNHYDSKRQLLCVQGPLWVDVFKRDGYTFDTNVAAIHVLEKMADAARAVGVGGAGGLAGSGEAGAAEYLALAAELRYGLEALWAGDHFISQRGRDWDSIQDMEDSDNYLAVAFAAVEPDRAAQILQHFDANPQMHPGGKGTWVSGSLYGELDCYDGNVGDSETAMARMFWADLRAKSVAGQVEDFAALYEAVRADLLNNTWMNERYSATGQMIRAAGYHEYPEVLDRMLIEGYYGLEIGVGQVTVRPAGVQSDSVVGDSFRFARPGVALEYGPERVKLQVPDLGLGGSRSASIWGMLPGVEYVDGHGRRWIADSSGCLRVLLVGGQVEVRCV